MEASFCVMLFNIFFVFLFRLGTLNDVQSVMRKVCYIWFGKKVWYLLGKRHVRPLTGGKSPCQQLLFICQKSSPWPDKIDVNHLGKNRCQISQILTVRISFAVTKSRVIWWCTKPLFGETDACVFVVRPCVRCCHGCVNMLWIRLQVMQDRLSEQGQRWQLCLVVNFELCVDMSLVQIYIYMHIYIYSIYLYTDIHVYVHMSLYSKTDFRMPLSQMTFNYRFNEDVVFLEILEFIELATCRIPFHQRFTTLLTFWFCRKMIHRIWSPRWKFGKPRTCVSKI